MRILRHRENPKVAGLSWTDGEAMFVNGSLMEWKEYKYEDLTAPCFPRKAVCVGLNYKSHIEEMHQQMPENPTLFIKPSTAVIGPNDYILVPPESQRVDYEGELAVVIRNYAYRVSKREAHRYVMGYTIANDVTARDLQSKDGQWTRAKSFNTFLPLGPWIETDVDPTNLNLRTLVNGEVRQQSNTSDLLFDVFDLVSFVSHVMTLEPFDVILTGTPSGVGPLKEGDEVVVEIDGIGRLVNRVKKLEEGES